MTASTLCGASRSSTPASIPALAEIVKGEDPSHPWSDGELVKQFALQGIKLARRTVAKYREELNILPSHRRRQFCQG